MAHIFQDNYSLWAIETFIFCELFRCMLRLYSAIIRLIIQGMFASEYVLALGRSKKSFWLFIQLNQKLKGGYNEQLKIRRNVFLCSVWKTQNRRLACRVVIYDDMLSLQVMTTDFGGLKTVSFFGFISYSSATAKQ